MPAPDTISDSTLPAETARLAGLLRAAGFQVAIQQCLHASRVLVHLKTIGPLPDDASTLAGYLGPIFCTNREQQEQFPKLVRQWLAPSTLPDSLPPSLNTKDTRTVGRMFPWKPGKKSLALILAFMAVLTTAAICWYQLAYHDIELTVLGDGEPLAGAEVRFDNRATKSGPDGTAHLKIRRSELGMVASVVHVGFRTQDQKIADFNPLRVNLNRLGKTGPASGTNPTVSHEADGLIVIRPQPFGQDMGRRAGVLPAPTRFDALALALLALPSLLFLIFWWWSRRRAELVFERRRAPEPPNLRDLPFPPGLRQAMLGLPVRQLARDLRRRRRTHSVQLDIQRTLEATVRRAGCYTPVFGSYTESEYLVLVDRSSPGDHLANLVDEVLQALKDAGVGYERLFFDGDPSLCRRPSQPGRIALEPTVRLDELAVRFAGHRLLMFTDGEPFFDPYTGQPANCVRVLSRWSEKGVVTPNQIEKWGRIEYAIERLGFTVFPLSPKGLRLLGHHFHDRPHSTLSPRTAASAEIPVHETGRTRWTERHPPTPARIEALCRSLKNSLGSDGFQWLAACCIYPELNWRLTQRIGVSLMANNPQHNTILASLVRLVWFRQSSIPDWLRRAILSRLSPCERDVIRQIVVEVLNNTDGSAGPSANGTDGSIPKVVIPSHTNALARTMPWEWIKRLRKRFKDERNFSKSLRQLPADSPMRDYVFLRFISGQPLDDLTSTVPERLRRILFPEGNPWLGPRSSALMLLGALVATAILFAFAKPTSIDRPGACVAISVDGTNDTMVALYRDGTVVAWPRLKDAINTGKSPLRIRTRAPIRSIALGGGNRLLAMGSQDGGVIVGSNGVLSESFDEYRLSTSNIPITAVALWIDSHGTFVVSGKDEGRFGVNEIKVGTNGNPTLLWGDPGTIFRSNRLDLGKPPREFFPGVTLFTSDYPGTNQTVRCIAVKSKSAAAGFEGGIGIAYFMDQRQDITQSAHPIDQGSFIHSRGPAVWSVDISPDEQCIAFGRLDGSISVSCNHASQGNRPPTPRFQLEGHSAAVFSVRFSPDGKFLVSTGLDGQILLWEVGATSESELFRRVSRILHPTNSGRYFWSAVFTADSRRIIAGASDGTIQILDFDPSMLNPTNDEKKGVPKSPPKY